MRSILRAYFDLLRLQFFFAWPILFGSGYLLATSLYGGFSWFGLLRVVLIGFFGFEAGLILNDYIDREFDKKDTETDKLTKYWRYFGTRPIPAGLVPPLNAAGLCILFVLITSALILTFPTPHSVYALLIMLFCYTIEIFYQEEKRKQSFPFAQLIGRIDFALFPIAGYLLAGKPDLLALSYFVFFYPFALAHLGVNDLVDVVNDRVRKMNTIPILYGMNGTVYWIAGFTAVHVAAAVLFMTRLGWISRVGIIIGLILVVMADAAILKNNTPDVALRALPLFHIAMVIYAVSIGLNALG